MLNARNGHIELNGFDCDYISFGRGEDPLIMLPGVGDGFKTAKGIAVPFAMMYRCFAENFKVYAFSRRNDLPEDYAPKKVIAMLNPLKNEIICVRGNCDTEVDQMVLDFNVLCEQAHIYVNDRHLVLAHGHKLDEKNIPALRDGDYLVCGHTHIPAWEKRGTYTYVNPGSVSIPKENSEHGYIILSDKFYWKNLDGEVYKTEE